MNTSHACPFSNSHAARLRIAPVVALSAAAVFAVAVAWADPVLWDPGAGGNAHFYERVTTPDGIRWDQAAQAAEARHWQGMAGHLVVITAPEENAWIWDQLDHPVGCWLGGRQVPGTSEPAADWQWVTGEVWSFTNWESGQPDSSGDGRLQFDPSTATGGWGDACADCAGKGYIVEYAPASTSDERPTWGAIKALF
jgi:hypothetical protein